MITSINLKNFRGFKDTELPLSRITMFTGENGSGKTSVLEGLYCLFSETRLDVSAFPRYQPKLGFAVQNGQQIPVSSYNYRLFWEEMLFDRIDTCSVSAKSDFVRYSWSCKKGKFNYADTNLGDNLEVLKMLQNFSMPDFVRFDWEIKSVSSESQKTDKEDVDKSFMRVQALPDTGGYFIAPDRFWIGAYCMYLDFLSVRAQPQEISHILEQKLRKGLEKLNPNITQVRFPSSERGLTVVIGDRETSIGTLGAGVAAWASLLILLHGFIDRLTQSFGSNAKNLRTFVLIDEFGAGIHYKIMRELWGYLGEFMNEYPNIQFAVTSHSADCVRSFCEEFKEKQASVVELYKLKADEPTKYIEYTPDDFDAIIAGDLEVRA